MQSKLSLGRGCAFLHASPQPSTTTRRGPAGFLVDRADVAEGPLVPQETKAPSSAGCVWGAGGAACAIPPSCCRRGVYRTARPALALVCVSRPLDGVTALSSLPPDCAQDAGRHAGLPGGTGSAGRDGRGTWALHSGFRARERERYTHVHIHTHSTHTDRLPPACAPTTAGPAAQVHTLSWASNLRSDDHRATQARTELTGLPALGSIFPLTVSLSLSPPFPISVCVSL